jgi:ABC-type transport system involved in cytochrome bd biosynthesis fused ATPase/permease subunit
LASIDPYVKIDGAPEMLLSQCLNWLERASLAHAQIIGESGMGKTTSLLSLYHRLAYSDNPNAPFGLFVSLNEINHFDEKQDKQKIKHFLIHKIARNLFFGNTDITQKQLDDVFEDAQTYV